MSHKGQTQKKSVNCGYVSPSVPGIDSKKEHGLWLSILDMLRTTPPPKKTDCSDIFPVENVPPRQKKKPGWIVLTYPCLIETVQHDRGDDKLFFGRGVAVLRRGIFFQCDRGYMAHSFLGVFPIK